MNRTAPGTAASSPSVRTSGLLLWAALGTVYLLWGSTYVGMRAVVETIPPFFGAGLRFLLAGVLLGAILVPRRGWSALRSSPQELAGAAVIGVLLLMGGNGLLMVGEQYVPAGFASLLFAAVPLWVALFRTATRDRPALATLAGVLVGFAGLAALLLPGSHGGDTNLGGAVTILVASLCWATGSFLSPRLPMPRDPFVSSAYEMTIGGAATLVLGLGIGELHGAGPASFSVGSWIGLGYLVVFGSVIAFTAFVWLLANAPISLVATYAYVNPVVAVALGALILGETVTAVVLLGGTIVLAGVALVVSTERRKAPVDSTVRSPRPR
ncbi:MAG: EamA family transporter [Streptosporangiales bacterium]|nr:EamA family transporter [Streptosporangiales bacterium]